MNSPGSPEQDLANILDQLDTTRNGLTSDEAAARLIRYGPNRIEEQKGRSPIILFLEKFKDPLIILLILSALISYSIGQHDDAIGISLAILIVVFLGFIQEYRSEKSVKALKTLITNRCHVKRDGVSLEIDSEQLVPGDVVVLGRGDRVPADIRLIESNSLTIDESMLTGESEASSKDAEMTSGESRLLADRKNMAFMGTLVTSGRALGTVIATAESTELGKIASYLQGVEQEKTPLQIKLDELGKEISLYALIVIAVIFFIGLIQKKPLLEMFTVGISLAVAAIPEGLPIVVTITLALGVTRMAGKKAIVRRLPAVEALGATTVICTDKTGTLTKNEMTVNKIFTNEFILVTGSGYEATGEFIKAGKKLNPKEDMHLSLLLRTAILCNNAFFKEGKLIGQPTEGALLTAAIKAGLKDERETLEKVFEEPFDSKKKWMHVQYRVPDGPSYFAKGALEVLLKECSHYQDGKKILRLDDKRTQVFLEAGKRLERDALRVLSFAHGESLENLVFLGFMGLLDPPRDEVRSALKEARESHVKVVMITGDSQETALAVANRLDLGSDDSSLSGAEVESLDDDDLAERLNYVSVLYRTAPEHKVKIVMALKKKGHIVAMTGDGVNDAPALKLSDIGVSMGSSGTDVAKEASDMVLVDDNFSTIMAAIEEGRTIYNNIKNFLRFEMTTSVAALSLIAFTTLLGRPLPLNPIQILWINVIMDGPPAQSLGVEPLDRDLMKKRPRKPDEPIIDRRMVFDILFAAAIMVGGTYLLFTMALENGVTVEKATTIAFTAFVFFQMFNAFNSRSRDKSTFTLGTFSNRYLLMAVGASLAMQMAVIYIPYLARYFRTVPLSPAELGLVTLISSTVLIADEIKKKVLSYKGL